jgi:CubicO group peptidase (beta-lactamase class C family)
MEGKLDLNDSLPAFLNNVPNDKQTITLHHILTHTSGLRKSVGFDYKRTNKSEFIERLLNSELKSVPGEKYGYSHAGYSLLGAVIERVSGMSYEDYLRENIFLPSGMENTGYVVPHWEEDQIAHGYRKCRDWGKPMDMPWDTDGPYWNLKANGGLLSSAADLMSWFEIMEDPGLLSESAIRKFFNPHVREGRYAGSFYGYGWVIARSSRNTEVIAHNGDNRMFYTEVLRYKTEDVTILVLSNRGKPGNDNIAFELAKIIFWPDHEAKVQGSLQTCIDSLPSNRIGQVAGKFLYSVLDNEIINIEQTDEFFSDYLQNKHSEDHIIEVLNDLKSHLNEPEITSVVITDYSSMEIYLESQRIDGEGRKRLYLRLIFDEEDHYHIRTLVYNPWRR